MKDEDIKAQVEGEASLEAGQLDGIAGGRRRNLTPHQKKVSRHNKKRTQILPPDGPGNSCWTPDDLIKDDYDCDDSGDDD